MQFEIAREHRLRWKPHNFIEPDFAPLLRALKLSGLPPSRVAEWAWLYEDPIGTHLYVHKPSSLQLKLSSDTPGDVCRLKLPPA